MGSYPAVYEESGTSQGWVHPHNGYWAGDFWAGSRTSDSHDAGSTSSTERGW